MLYVVKEEGFGVVVVVVVLSSLCKKNKNSLLGCSALA
jgi:hypothetical protein